MKNLLVVVFTLLNLSVSGQAKPPVYTTDAGAIQGYDPVAYFTESKPVQGKPELTYSWNNAQWHFSSQENLDLFKATPEMYAPQYGGYCAFTVASGRKETTDPQFWNIVNGKLYLHYNAFVQKTWNKNPKGLIAQADKKWPGIMNN